MPEVYIADRVFTGEQWLDQHAVITDKGSIVEVVPAASLPASMSRKEFPGHFIAPAFIDLQIYGAYGKLLSVFPEEDALHKLRDYCAKGGAAYCLPTVATNTKEVFYKSVDAIRSYWKNGGQGILGIHLEGPWINAIKRGAHIEALIHAPSMEEVKELLEYGKGVIKIITLAPEICSKEIIAYVRSQGIVISAGHSNATYKEAKDGFANGITTVTHLYNAMSPLQHREPGLAGAAMDDDTVFASIIPDGHHVDFAAIRIAKKVMKERLFVITDAVTDTTDGAYQHYLNGDKYEAAGILSGSALDMLHAIRNLVSECVISLEEALRMCSTYPAKVIGEEKRLGKIHEKFESRIAVVRNDLGKAFIL
jgi:N-acetylglucosamine-6-phosphate deacetylase